MSCGDSRGVYERKSLSPYLMLPGTCRQALTFYQECLGGKIVLIQSFADSPIDVPKDCEQRIFNSEFRADGVLIRASDDLPMNPVKPGSNFALFVGFAEAGLQEVVFSKLSAGGEVLFPLADGFGMQWMLARQ